MTRIASRVSQLNGEGALAVFSRAKELELQGRSIIHLELGEPDFHAAAPVVDALRDAVTAGRDRYCSPRGVPALRQAIAAWLARRYGVTLDPATQVLPVSGSREALFALAQTVIDPTRPRATVVCPNPFYQIYEGAALLEIGRAHV